MAEDSLPDAARVGAARAAYRALRPLLMSERAFLASVTGVTLRIENLTRVLYSTERRSIVHRTEPAPGVRKAQVSEFEPCTLSPWSADPASLPGSTRQVCECLTCQGLKKVACGTCSGSAKVRCKGCSGSGQVPGKRGMKKCSGCRGSGQARCASCSNGKVQCPTCEGAGRVVSWFEVERTALEQVRATPAQLAERWHREVLAPRDFDRRDPPHALQDDSPLKVHELDQLPEGLRPVLTTNERVVAARAQSFSVELHSVRYRTALSEATVEVTGSPLRACQVDARPLRWRMGLALGTALLASMAALWSVERYRAQHAWFAEQGEGGTGLLLGLLAALLTGIAGLGWLQAKPARSGWTTLLPSLSAVCLALAGGTLLLNSHPTVQEARAALQTGDLTHALLVADALQATGAVLDDSEPLFDELRLARLRATSSLEAQVALIGEPGWSKPAHSQALALLQQLAGEQAERAQAARDYQSMSLLANTVAPALPALSQSLHVRALDENASACLARDDFDCLERLLPELATRGAHEAEARLRVLAAGKARQRLEAALAGAHDSNPRDVLRSLEAASRLVTALAALGSPVAPTELEQIERGRTAAQAQVAKLERAEEALAAKQRERAEREARREQEREERAARAEQRRAEQAERQQARALVSRSYAMLQCCDGTLSPSCSCDRDSNRGCCSHHGGVCGCGSD